MSERYNRNRLDKKLRVWQDAVAYYRETWSIFDKFPYRLDKIVSQQVNCVDSIQRNISEGSCRKSIKEYLNFLNIAKGSIGESVSSLETYRDAGHLTLEEYDHLDKIAYRIEGALLNLIASLEQKRDSGDWSDSLILKEDEEAYGDLV